MTEPTNSAPKKSEAPSPEVRAVTSIHRMTQVALGSMEAIQKAPARILVDLAEAGHAIKETGKIPHLKEQADLYRAKQRVWQDDPRTKKYGDRRAEQYRTEAFKTELAISRLEINAENAVFKLKSDIADMVHDTKEALGLDKLTPPATPKVPPVKPVKGKDR